MRDSFLMYRSFITAARKVKNKAQRLSLYEAIFDLALDDVDTELDDAIGALFDLIRPQVLANNKRYQNGSKAKAKPKQTESKTEANKNVNENVNENENVVKEKTKREVFSKPTIEDITSYCRERNNNVDPQKFYDFYESKGWMVGKNKMKDWKAAVRTWERNSPIAKASDYVEVLPNWMTGEKEEEYPSWWTPEMIADYKSTYQN